MKNIKLPDYWTPEQATAVFEFIDEIREAILIQYRLQLMEQMRLDRCTKCGLIVVLSLNRLRILKSEIFPFENHIL